jgi:helicase SWR1
MEAVDISVDSPLLYKRPLIESPSQLLNLRRDRVERSKRVEEMVKRFVFCVPKAAARALPSVSPPKMASTVKDINTMLLEPITEYTRPFSEARTRLSAEFPDKKLVQFDSGKLQKLSELLRERKRGGHKVLIFTQMSKMVRCVCREQLFS